MSAEQRKSPLPPPIVIECSRERLNDLLSKEWLISNRIGAYASSTVIGCNTRRYHGLLIAATSPPVGRIAALSTVMEQLVVGEERYDLATNEFPGAFSPGGISLLSEYRDETAPTFIWRAGGIGVIKQIILAEAANAVAVRYTITGGSAELLLRPFVALRDYHELRSAADGESLTFEATGNHIVIQDHRQLLNRLHLMNDTGSFSGESRWWYRFLYRTDLARGQEGFEDLYCPGAYACILEDGQSCQLTASLNEPVSIDFDATVRRRRDHCAKAVEAVGASADEPVRRLAAGTGTFLARRSLGRVPFSSTVLAGFHWFADWGRDTFISLPGLLLATGRFTQARQIFATFAKYISNGMIPNRFDDGDAPPHYNSIDASLWFIIAADRYVEATGDAEFFGESLMPAAHTVLTAYHEGTDFGIGAGADGLLAGGSQQTQLTWMDAAIGTDVVTPRHGKAVEVNALWHSAHRIMSERCAAIDDKLAGRYRQQSDVIAKGFAKAFWNDSSGCLYDCVTNGEPDPTIRPNQILAVSLPHSPLSTARQQAVVAVVQEKLLTPMGLRTLAAEDRRYRGRHEGPPRRRDRAYHQGTVWPWLMGPFIEAYLKVRGNKASAVAQAEQWLSVFDAHLGEAGIGYVSEIFDGDPPQRPRGCIAQAWSVAEILRAKLLVAAAKRRSPRAAKAQHA